MIVARKSVIWGEEITDFRAWILQSADQVVRSVTEVAGSATAP